MEFVLNKCYGGFGLSEEACEALNTTEELERNDERLVACIKVLGKEASARYAKLEIVSIPDDCTDYEINDYDGWESLTYVVNGKIYHA